MLHRVLLSRIDAAEWRLRINSIELRMRHGIFLEGLADGVADRIVPRELPIG